MANPVVCAACGVEAPNVSSDEVFVCNACLGLPDPPTAATKPPPAAKPGGPPPARRVAEAVAGTPQPPDPSPSPRKALGSWPAVARGYRHLCSSLVILLLGTILTAFVRILETAYKVPLLGARISLGLLLLTLVGAVVMRLLGAVAVARKPRRGRVRGLAAAVRGFAFVPLVGLLVFPLLLAVYTQAVGRETGKRSVRRGGWILLGCAVVHVPPIASALASLGVWALGLLVVFLYPPSNARPPAPAPAYDPAASYLLFALGAGATLWLGAYIVTMMTLSGVARALEQDPSADPTDSHPDTNRPTDEPARHLPTPEAVRADPGSVPRVRGEDPGPGVGAGA